MTKMTKAPFTVISGITHSPALRGIVTKGPPTVFSLQKPTLGGKLFSSSIGTWPQSNTQSRVHPTGADGFIPAKLADAFHHSTSYSGIKIARIKTS